MIKTSDGGRCFAKVGSYRCDRCIGHEGPHSTSVGHYEMSWPGTEAVQAPPAKRYLDELERCIAIVGGAS